MYHSTKEKRTSRHNCYIDTRPARRLPARTFSLMVVAAITLATAASSSYAGWQLQNSDHSVSGTAYDTGTYSWGEWYISSSYDATADVSSTEVSVSGGGSCETDIRTFASSSSVTLFGAHASWSAEAWADFQWSGPAGYPSGPENFEILISGNFSGGSEAYGGAGPYSEASSAAASHGEGDLSGTIDGGSISSEGHANVSGAANPTYSTASADVAGDSWSEDPYYSTQYYQYDSTGSFEITIDIDYVINIQTPPSIHVVASMGSGADSSMTTWLDPIGEEGQASAHANSGVSGGVSVSLGSTW